MHSPMSFFETTPQGRIMNRFSKDISGIDDVVPQTLMAFLRTFFSVIGAMFTISYATPIFLVVILPLLALYVLVQVRVVLFLYMIYLRVHFQRLPGLYFLKEQSNKVVFTLVLHWWKSSKRNLNCQESGMEVGDLNRFESWRFERRELKQRQRRREKAMIWLVEWGNIIVLHVRHALQYNYLT